MVYLSALIPLAFLLGVLGGFLIWRLKPRRPDPTDRLLLLSQALPDPVLLIDNDHRIGMVNRAGERLFQLESSKLVGRKLADIPLYPTLRQWFNSITGDPPLVDELRLARQGPLHTYQPLIVPTGAGQTLVILRDISTLAGAVQMKTDFVANASHELRTPISAIKVAFETLREVYLDDPAQTQRCFSIIDGHLTRLEEMLSDLLDLSRVESPQRKPRLMSIDSIDLIAQVRSLWLPIAQDRRVRLNLPDPFPPTFKSDRHLLDLVLKNLVENAIKFTPSGGTVTLSIERRANGNEIELKVTDTGCGIPAEQIERVFERFYQVDSARSSAAGRGTGLGLAIVKHAVHLLGGTVRLTSQINQGTTAICTLPQ